MQKKVNLWQNKTITSVADGYEAFILSQMANVSCPLIYIASDGVNLVQTASMLRLLHPQWQVREFPAWDTVPYDRVSPNSSVIAKRIDTLSQITFMQSKTPVVIVTSIGAIMQKLPPQKIFRNARKNITLKIRQK